MGDETVVDIEFNAGHSRNPRLDLFEIIAETVATIVQQQEHLTNSERDALAHLRNMTRQHKNK